MEARVNVARLSELIKEQYGSQSQFADACGVSRQFISQILKHEAKPSFERLVVFATLLDVPMEQLVEKDSAPEPVS